MLNCSRPIPHQTRINWETYFDNPVALDAENFEVDETIEVFQPSDLVLAEVQLLQLGQAFQVLDLADPLMKRSQL